MAVEETPRFGLPQWTDDQDTVTRNQFNDAFAAIEELAANHPKDGVSAVTDAFTIVPSPTGGWSLAFSDGSTWSVIPSNGGNYPPEAMVWWDTYDQDAWLDLQDPDGNWGRIPIYWDSGGSVAGPGSGPDGQGWPHPPILRVSTNVNGSESVDWWDSTNSTWHQFTMVAPESDSGVLDIRVQADEPTVGLSVGTIWVQP